MKKQPTIISLIVACDNQGGIAKNGSIPWNFPQELRYFSKVTRTTKDPTKQNAILMGRKTWESLPRRPLPNRVNIVLSTKPTTENSDPNIVFVSSIETALEYVDKNDLTLPATLSERKPSDQTLLVAKPPSNFSGDKVAYEVSSEEATRSVCPQSTFGAQGLRPPKGVSDPLPELVVKRLHVPCAPCQTSPVAKPPSKLVVLGGQRPLCEGYKERKPSDQTHPVAKLPSELVVEGLRPSDQIEQLYVIGGEQIYHTFMTEYSSMIDHIYYTEIQENYQCDQYFPVTFLEKYTKNKIDTDISENKEVIYYRYDNIKT